jgi:chemotaxis protein CheC
MDNPRSVTEEKLLTIFKKIAGEGIHHALEGLTQMVGQDLTCSEPIVEFVDIMAVPNLIGGPETEVVGIYLRAEGKMSGQFMLLLSTKKALQMVDMLMGDPPGTCTELDKMGRSALAEMGNLSGTFFLNSVASMTRLESMPTPPAVMEDYAGAILNVVVATSAQNMERVLMIITKISHEQDEVEASFWYIPDATAMTELEKVTL